MPAISIPGLPVSRAAGSSAGATVRNDWDEIGSVIAVEVATDAASGTLVTLERLSHG